MVFSGLGMVFSSLLVAESNHQYTVVAAHE